MSTNRKVIAGPAGHWYAVWSDWQFGDTLIGLPMSADDPTAPPYPDDIPTADSGWYEITDPAPGCDDQALIDALTTDDDDESTGDLLRGRDPDETHERGR